MMCPDGLAWCVFETGAAVIVLFVIASAMGIFNWNDDDDVWDDDEEEYDEYDVRQILIDVIPGDGSGIEVYAKSVADVEAKLSKLGLAYEHAYCENVTLRAKLAALQKDPV